MMACQWKSEWRAAPGLLAMFFILAALCGGCRQQEPEPKTETAKVGTEEKLALIMPATGAYTGAYVDFGEGEDEVTYDALTAFEQMTGKHLAVVAFGSFWGEQNFPTRIANIVSAYGAVPLIFWSPWDKPYEESKGPDRFNLPDILAGKWDQYIDQWADAARAYGKPLLVTWGLEANGRWFPWSGIFYGADKVIGHRGGHPLYAGPELVKQANRYVIDRVRAKKADNILWGFHVNNYSSPRSAWNRMANYYPGTDYVDWLGMSVYGKMDRNEGWAKFNEVMDDPYAEICRLDADKPVFLAEWGVGEFPPGDKAEFITRALADVRTRYPRVRVGVFWHERWQNSDGTYSNLRVNSSPEALEAYRRGIADPSWIDRPQFKPKAAAP